jgi:hypothetical protein
MKNIKYKLKNIIASGTTIFLMATGCATLDDQPQNEEKATIILSKDVESNDNLSNSERVCFQSALKEVRNKEAQKHSSDTNEQKYALKCFDACGGAFIKKGNQCKYMPSKYEFDKDVCLCNGQDIMPHKQKEQAELELVACQKICESANTDQKQYAVDWVKTHPFGECVCKVVKENAQNQK